MEVLIEGINNDDEAYYKNGRQILGLYLKDVNSAVTFIAICGWSVDCFLEKL